MRTKRFKNSKHHHGGMCSSTTVCILLIVCFSSIILILGSVTGVIFALVDINRPCTEHKDCLTKNPCTEDICDMDSKTCVSHKIEGCCVEDKDCGSRSCYNAFCDPISYTCKLHPPMNGSICNDHNECTIDDRCVGYSCEGKRLTCATASTCSTGVCLKGTGCVFNAALDGVSCDDNNKCTLNDQCWKGMCASGRQKDCSHYDSACSKGVCDTVTGNCVAVPINEKNACDDKLMCTIQDQCIQGKCVGLPNTCYDNNPCTINKCVEGVGCMLKHEDFNKTCSSTCHCDDVCPYEYVCVDGTCVRVNSNISSQIRFIDYEIEICPSGGHRLLMDYVLDSSIIRMGNDTRYVIPKSLNDISASSTNLGFIDIKKSLQSMLLTTDISRSAFTLGTACQNVTQENCASIFAMRRYKFHVELYHCMTVAPNDPNCIDTNMVVSASIDLSISDCTQFTQYQFIPLYGVAVLYAGTKRYTGLVQHDPLEFGVSYITVGYETPAYNNPSVIVMTTNFRICRPNVNHYLYKCVAGKDSNCINTGCFGWDSSDSPILEKYDMVTNGYVTSLAKSTWGLTSCYDENDYNSPTSVKCSHNKCPNTTNGKSVPWPAPMDDGFRFKTTYLGINESAIVKKEWTFDIQFRLYICNASRRLRNSNQVYHNIVTLSL